MGSRIDRLINADITDPMTQNAIIYIITYVLSIALSTIPYLGLFGPSDKGGSTFWQTFADCVVPATVTLTAGTVIQNIAYAIQQRNGRCILTICSGLAAIVYLFLYRAVRNQNSSCLSFIICAVSVAVSGLNLFAIRQVIPISNTSPSPSQ